jgi:hypothetical protein
VQLGFHFYRVKREVLKDIFQLIVAEGGIHHGHFIYISQLTEVIAGKHLAFADGCRQ